jgi:hypothetical protein
MLRYLIQNRPRLKVLLSGSHTLDELRQWSGYLINTQVIPISRLHANEAAQLIERPIPHFPLRYEPEASRQVWELTAAHPYLVQLLCSEIVALKNDQPLEQRRLARCSDIAAAVPQALTHGALFFEDIDRNQLDPPARELLKRIAAGQTGVEPEQSALVTLLRRELITPRSDGPGYAVSVELIRRWFARPGTSRACGV